jgi:YidC/Oxa1 family membrane protein insertase
MSTEPNKPDPKDLPINMRMLVAFALTGLVIFGTPYFYKAIGIKLPEKTEQQSTPDAKPQAGAKSTPASTSTPAAAAAKSQAKPNQAQASPAAGTDAAGTVAASAEEEISVDTDVYHIVFSNRGGVVKNWTLKEFPDHERKPLDVVNVAAAPKTGFPFQYEFRGAKPASDLSQSLFRAHKTDDGLSVTFDFSNAGVTAHKAFDFKRNSYLVQVSSSVSLNGQPLPHLLAWRGGFGDMAVPNAPSQEHGVFYDAAADKVDRKVAKDAKNGPLNVDGPFAWVGLEDQYFAAVLLPSGNATIQTTVFDDQVKTRYNATEESFMGLAVGGQADGTMTLYLGPKDPDALRTLNPKLATIVDFGWFAIIAKPLFVSLHWIYNNWFHNWGWSIIAATVIINLVLFPLKLANLKSMRKMQGLQPEIAKINEKYKALPLRDPRQADKNAEMMALYSKAGTNPMSGCIPMLVQMPFLFAFYKVLSISIALRGADWLWVTDLSQPEQIAIRVLPVVLVITGFIMQKMTPMTTVDPTQQKTMMLMPLMMGFIFYQAQSGLVLYWLTGNLVGIAQQWILNKAMPKPDAPAPPTRDVKKSNNRK